MGSFFGKFLALQNTAWETAVVTKCIFRALHLVSYVVWSEFTVGAYANNMNDLFAFM